MENFRSLWYMSGFLSEDSESCLAMLSRRYVLDTIKLLKKCLEGLESQITG